VDAREVGVFVRGVAVLRLGGLEEEVVEVAAREARALAAAVLAEGLLEGLDVEDLDGLALGRVGEERHRELFALEDHRVRVVHLVLDLVTELREFLLPNHARVAKPLAVRCDLGLPHRALRADALFRRLLAVHEKALHCRAVTHRVHRLLVVTRHVIHRAWLVAKLSRSALLGNRLPTVAPCG